MPRPLIFNPSTSAGGRRQRTESCDSHGLTPGMQSGKQQRDRLSQGGGI